MITASLTQTPPGHVTLSGHGLTIGACAGAVIFYKPSGGANRKLEVGTSGGVIGTQYMVDTDGTVNITLSLQLVTGGHQPGLISAALATTAGELTDATLHVT